MYEPEQGGPEISRILTLPGKVWQHLADVGFRGGSIPDELVDEQHRGLDAGEIELIRSQVVNQVEFLTPRTRRYNRLVRTTSQNALLALGRSALVNGDFITSGSVIQRLDPGWKIWRVRAIRASVNLEEEQDAAMADH